MKLLTFAFVFAVSFSSFADTITCSATTTMDKAKKLITASETFIEIEGEEPRAVLEVVKIPIDGRGLKKCAGQSPARQYKCLNKLVPGAKEGDPRLSLHNLLIMIADLEPDNKEAVGTVSTLDVTTKVDINLNNVSSGVAYVTEYNTYYPNAGMYEFFNARGDSLGKVFLEAFPRNCR